MALNLLIWDKNADAGIVGQSVNQKIMGELMPSYLTREKQFIRPISNNPRGFILTGGTYISMTVKDADETPRNLVFGSPVDTEYKFVEQLLDDGVALQVGKDYYIYLVLNAPSEAQPLYTADIKVSLNSTYPEGYSADTSRKIGGFHTLCAAVGTIAGHWLSGFNAGDILPASFWDLSHRPTCQPEGMVYVKELDFWCDIYLQSGSGVNTKSVFGGTTTDSQTKSQHVEDLFRVGKTPLQDEEFQCAAEGSNQGTNIQNSADPVTTGGHVDKAGRRMVSNYGLEDCCGALWQWLAGWSYGSNQTAAYVSDGGKGQIYQVNALLAGGHWASGAYCGSRARYAAHSRLYVSAYYGCRGRARSRVER